MSLYGSFFEECNSIEEGSFEDLMDKIKDWKTSDESSIKKEFETHTLSDEDYMKFKKVFKVLHKGNYEEYKKAFKELCNFCHIVPNGTIITKYKLTKSDVEDKNSLYVEYAFNQRKIDLPDDVALYHMSKIGGIKKLKPTFRGKSERGYLYDKPRIYFTINKNLPKVAADYKLNQKMYKYKCKENISSVYIDPLINNSFMGAVYIETDKEIPVEPLN